MKGIFAIYSVVWQVVVTGAIFLLIGLATLFVGEKLFSLLLASFAALLSSLSFALLILVEEKSPIRIKAKWFDVLGYVWPVFTLFIVIIVLIIK